MRRRPSISLLGWVLAVATLAAGGSTAVAGQPEHEVPWTIDAALRAQSEAPNAPPAGANDYRCKPRPRHREPVVLLHGLLANRAVNWATISPYLANRGFCVFALTYGTRPDAEFGSYRPGGLTRMQPSARQLGRFVNRVLRKTGAREVDLVGHSEGSLMPSWYVRFQGGARKVDDYVGLTTLWDGTNLAGLANLSEIADVLGIGGPAYATVREFCSSCKQFLRNSHFFRKLRARGIFSPRVDYTSIVTRNDELVFPYTSGIAPPARNRRNVVLQDYCPLDQAEHASVMADPVTAGFVHRALDPRRAPNPPCVPVLPFVGAPGYSGN